MDEYLLNRREFLGVGAGVAAAGVMRGALSVAVTRPGETGAVAGAPDWFDKPMRWGQLVLVENDPGNYDAEFWLDVFKRLKVDAVCLSAGGCVCYYPTAIPLHYKSAWMKEGTDPFGELVEGCRKMGLIVMARTDPHSIRDDAAAAHPEWVAVDAAGNRRKHWAAPNRWVTCAFGDYNWKFMTEVHREILQKYPAVSGIFVNRWQGSGMCFCEVCRSQFQSFSGMALPRGQDPKDAAYRKYLEWSGGRLFDLWRMWDAEAKKVNPAACVVANTGGGSTSTLDMVTIGKITPLMVADRQSRRGMMAPWMAGKSAKEFRATLGDTPVLGLAALGIDDDHRWKDSVINDAELRMWIADGVAHGFRPWMCKFGGVVYDQRWLATFERMYGWHAANEKYLRNVRNLARVGMVYSQQTGTFYGGTQKASRVEDHELGMYQALVEARVPFEMVHDGLLDPERIGRFKLLILPNTAALSDRQCDQIRAFVRNGGNVLATFETSLYDEKGEQRRDFGLADVFGVSVNGATETGIKNSYMHVEAQTGHAVLRGLEDAGRIINTVQRVNVKAVAEFGKPVLTRVPGYPDLPMEEVYPRVAHTEEREVFLREMPGGAGGGRVVYVPGDLERTFWEVMAVDHLVLLKNLIGWALNEEPVAGVTGAGVVDVAVWEQAGSMAVHLVNLTNPMMLKASIREIFRIGPLEVRVRLPAGKAAREVRLLVSGKAPRVVRGDGEVRVTVESVEDFEVIAVDY